MLPKSTTGHAWRMLLAVVVTILLMPLGLFLASPSAALAPPSRPGNFTTTHDGDLSVKLNWTDTSKNERALGIRYRVKDGTWTSLRSISSSTIAGTGKKYTTTHVVPSRGVTYCYQVTAASLDGVGTSPESCAVPTVRNQHQLVPSYFYPGSSSNQWPSMCSRMNVRGNGSVAVLNPNSGPGAKVDANYTAAITDCHKKSQKVIGYVYTKYGERPLSAVKKDVDKYYSQYSVDGIFVDEMSNEVKHPKNGQDNRQYYRDLYRYVHSKTVSREIVVGNPGTPAKDDWQIKTPAADVLVVFENTATKYLAWNPPAWVRTADSPSRFSHLVHTTPADKRRAVCEKSKLNNAGHIYVTDDVLPNPWDRLPSYWSKVAPVCV